MRKIVMLVAFLVWFSPAAQAQEDQVPHPVKKIVWGAYEVVESPKQIFVRTAEEMAKEDVKPYGLLKGLIVSPFYMLGQAGHGLTQIVTFPLK